MILKLIGNERSRRETDSLLKQSSIEIAHADVANLSRSHGLVQKAYLLGERYAFVRPMQQQEIDVVTSQLPEAFVDRRGKPALRKIIDPYFRGNKDLRARNAGSSDAFPHLLLVSVDLRGVDVAEASLQSCRNHSQHFPAGHSIGAEPDSRYLGAVGEHFMHQCSP